MESSSVKLGVILLVIGLAIFTHAYAGGEHWEKYAENEKILCCYDAGRLIYFNGESVSQPSKNILQVWVKFEYTDIGLADPVLVKKFKKKVNELDNSKSLYEINCANRKYRVLESTFYSKDGRVLLMNAIPSTWKYIPRESLNDALHQAVCK
jgi:hypothetical protein